MCCLARNLEKMPRVYSFCKNSQKPWFVFVVHILHLVQGNWRMIYCSPKDRGRSRFIAALSKHKIGGPVFPWELDSSGEQSPFLSWCFHCQGWGGLLCPVGRGSAKGCGGDYIHPKIHLSSSIGTPLSATAAAHPPHRSEPAKVQSSWQDWYQLLPGGRGVGWAGLTVGSSGTDLVAWGRQW